MLQIHYYSSNVEKQALNEVCCGVEAIASGLACCNYVGYDPDTHVCADHGHSMSGNVCRVVFWGDREQTFFLRHLCLQSLNLSKTVNYIIILKELP